MIRFFISILAILCISIECYSQLRIDDLDLSRIPQRKICAFFDEQCEHDVYLLSEIKANCFSEKHISDYIKMENTYLVKENPDSLWYVYRNTSVSKLWNGKRISFGLLYSRYSDSVCYRDESCSSGVDRGQIFFINLRLLLGAVNLADGLEIVNVDDINKTITYSYLEGGKSQGQQIFQLLGTPGGYTKIVHVSYFKSDFHFRDKHLYPIFHSQVINEFHRNVSRLISNEKDYFRVIR